MWKWSISKLLPKPPAIWEMSTCDCKVCPVLRMPRKDTNGKPTFHECISSFHSCLYRSCLFFVCVVYFIWGQICIIQNAITCSCCLQVQFQHRSSSYHQRSQTSQPNSATWRKYQWTAPPGTSGRCPRATKKGARWFKNHFSSTTSPSWLQTSLSSA